MNDTDDYFKDRTDIVFVLQVGILVPLSIVGTLLNVVSFWVWQAERKKCSTTLLFMYLAVTDTIQLVFKSLGLLGDYNVVTIRFTEIAYLVAELGIVISVHTTTLIAINRWYAIWKPLHVRDVMTRRRVIIMYFVTSLWAAILVAIIAACHFNSDYFQEIDNGQTVNLALITGTFIMARVIPILVLLVCSISIVWMTVRYRRKFKGFATTAAQSKATRTQSTETITQSTETTTQSAETDPQSDAAAKQSTEISLQSIDTAPQSNAAVTSVQSTETAPQSNAAAKQSIDTAPHSKSAGTQSTETPQSNAARTRSTADDRQRRLTLTVLCIAGCTFIVFPLGTSVTLSTWFAFHTLCEGTCLLIIVEVVNILQAINCGINFVFYTASCTKFRELLKQRVSSWLCCVKGRPPDTQLN